MMKNVKKLLLLLLCCLALFSVFIVFRQIAVGKSLTQNKFQESGITTTAMQDAVSEQEAVNSARSESQESGKPIDVKEGDIPEQEGIRFVEGFYRALTAPPNFLTHQDEGFRIEKYITKRAMEKNERVGKTTNADPIIHAQDFNDNSYKTLQAKSLGNDWYIVSYQWYPNDEKSITNIPLKLIIVDGRYMIDYITPEWHGSHYGDSLLCDHIEVQPIDNTSPFSFVETFYNAYLSEYARMPEDLLPLLATLRVYHFTPNAQTQFENAYDESMLDSRSDYDLLIDGFDFDCMWLSTVTYTQLNETAFQMHYVSKVNYSTTISVGIVESNGAYKIDKIQKGE